MKGHIIRPAQSNHDSKCKNCDPRFCTYSSHIAHLRPQAHLQEPLLGNEKQFCESFFHIFKCPEFQVEEHSCTSPDNNKNCRLQSIALIARIGSQVARYTNCRSKHAEYFFLEDRPMQTYIEKQLGGTLTLYVKYQMCHMCGGNATIYKNGYLFNGQCDNRSCSLLILKYFREYLKPKQIQLVIKMSSLYKCNWLYAKREDDIITVKNALDGVHLLLFEPGIYLSALTSDDWLFLASLTTGVEKAQLLHPLRFKTDNGINQFFESERKKQADRTMKVVSCFFHFLVFVFISRSPNS